jgi:hypothetical protein
MRWLYTTTTGWALVLCLLALGAAPLLPWGRRELAPRVLRYGYEFLLAPEPLAWVIVLALFLTACFLVATQPLVPVRLWRSALLALAGGAITGLSAVAMYGLLRGPVGSLHVGPFFVAAVGAALVVVASLEVRYRLLDTTEASRRNALRLLADDVSDHASPPLPPPDPTQITTRPDRDG